MYAFMCKACGFITYLFLSYRERYKNSDFHDVFSTYLEHSILNVLNLAHIRF